MMLHPHGMRRFCTCAVRPSRHECDPITVRRFFHQRRLASSSSSSSSKAGRQRVNERQNFQEQQHYVPKWPAIASIAIVPIMFGAWQAMEWKVGNRQIGLNEQLRKQFQAKYSNATSSSSLETKPILFHCVIRKTTGFTHCLTGVQIGDVVDVLEEGVGPDKTYNMCRLPAKHGDHLSIDTYGWFPYRWLQKLDQYEAILQNLGSTSSHDGPEVTQDAQEEA